MVAERNLDPSVFLQAGSLRLYIFIKSSLQWVECCLYHSFAQALFPEPWEVVLPFLAFAGLSLWLECCLYHPFAQDLFPEP